MSAVYPDAETVAAALVAASERTGEDPLGLLSRPPLRAQWATLHALQEAYPELPWKCLARMAGIGGADSQDRLRRTRLQQWWPGAGEQASRAALRAFVANQAASRAPEPPEAKPAPPSRPSAGCLADRILAQIENRGALTASSLAIVCAAKESAVDQALADLAHRGLVAADPADERGLRHRRWRIVREAAA